MEYLTLSDVYRQVVNCKKMRIWKEQVMERDGFTCRRCGRKESTTKELCARISIDANNVTRCLTCNRKVQDEIKHRKKTGHLGCPVYNVPFMKEHLGKRFDKYWLIEGDLLFRIYKSTKLHVHHVRELGYLLKLYSIETLSQAIEFDPLWDLNNGMTLCKGCHYYVDFERRREQYLTSHKRENSS